MADIKTTIPAQQPSGPPPVKPGFRGETSAVKERKFPCKGCGADLVFAPGQNALKCPMCGHVEKIPQSAAEIKEYSFNDYLSKPKSTGYGRPPDQARDARCQGCSAVIQLDANIRATKCPYCGAPLITDDDKSANADVITPEAIVPFKVSLAQAQQKFREWLSTRWFAPSSLTSESNLKQFMGVYRPYWTYDSHTASDWAGQRGDYYYTTETYSTVENGQNVTKTRQVRHTAWTPVAGIHTDFFDDVLVRAGKNEDRSGDFNLKELHPYSQEYLSGFGAERYQVAVEDGWKMAKKVIDQSIYNSVLHHIGGDEQRVDGINTAYTGITYKHILLPIWVNAYLYMGTSYYFEINGQTGVASGTRPYSAWKIAAFVAAILFVILLIVGVIALANR